MSICVNGTLKAIIVPLNDNIVYLLVQPEDSQEIVVFFDQFVEQLKLQLKVGDAIIVNAQQTQTNELQGLTLEFTDYQLKSQPGSLPEQLAHAYRKMMLMQKILMQAGQRFKQAGDDKNARYYLGRSIALRLEMPSLAKILEICQIAIC